MKLQFIFILLFWPMLCFGQRITDTSKNPIAVRYPGDLTYNFVHFVASADSIDYTPTVSAGVYTKLLPVMVAHENDGFTFADDSLTIITPGDYFINISVRFSGANANDIWRIKVFKDKIALGSSIGRFVVRTTAAAQPDTKSFFWYLEELVADNVIDFRITNFTASRNPTFRDFKIYMEKKPE